MKISVGGVNPNGEGPRGDKGDDQGSGFGSLGLGTWRLKIEFQNVGSAGLSTLCCRCHRYYNFGVIEFFYYQLTGKLSATEIMVSVVPRCKIRSTLGIRWNQDFLVGHTELHYREVLEVSLDETVLRVLLTQKVHQVLVQVFVI